MTAHINPHAYLYKKPNAIPFAGYAPESDFTQGHRVVVARLPSVNNSLYNAVIVESQVPAVIMQGHIYTASGPILRISAGTSAEIIPVLYAFCKGFTDGSVALEPSAEHVVLVRMWEAHASTFVCFSESAMPLPENASGVTLYFKDMSLAKTVAQHMLAQMLGVRWFAS